MPTTTSRKRYPDWPRFERPSETFEVTVFDVAMAGSIDAHATLVHGWATAVWSSWRPAHDLVISLADERLPIESRTVRGAVHSLVGA